ncbi:hypothetical protein ScPMuIL_012211 [Solemya velum]
MSWKGKRCLQLPGTKLRSRQQGEEFRIFNTCAESGAQETTGVDYNRSGLQIHWFKVGINLSICNTLFFTVACDFCDFKDSRMIFFIKSVFFMNDG